MNFFETDDDELHRIYQGFTNGEITCGETKRLLSNKLIEIVVEHQKRLSSITDDQVRMFYSKEK